MGDNSLKRIPYKYLYDNIVSYNLKPGEAIVEQEISDLLGISRTPVRDAIKLLESDGLVRRIPGRGTFVENLSAEDVEELFQLRIAFEELALNAGIFEIPEIEILQVEDYLSKLDDESSSEKFYKSDRMLHQMILNYSKNNRMINFMKTINSQLERIRRVSALTPKRFSKSKKEHLEIVCSIKERDLDQSLELLRKHLENVKKSSIDVCQKLRYNFDLNK